MIAGSGSVIADVIQLPLCNANAYDSKTNAIRCKGCVHAVLCEKLFGEKFQELDLARWFRRIESPLICINGADVGNVKHFGCGGFSTPAAKG